MSPSKTTIAVRLPTELLKRVDAYATALAKEAGIEVTRTDAVRKLLAAGFEAEGRKRKKR